MIRKNLHPLRALAAIGVLGTAACSSDPAAEAPLAPRLENMGDLDVPITTDVADAQRFFNQGMALVYGFNHPEAVRSFSEAARLDPDCAMCSWGQALALGPNINDGAPDADRERRAFEAVRRAAELADAASERERALIEALGARHPSPEPDKAARNQAYAAAMAAVYERFPDDPDVGTLYAAALMNTSPWDYWADGRTLKAELSPLLPVLEKLIAAHPRHPGGHHYYIHAVEASDDPDRGVPSADRLGGLAPAAGHLVHMPSHIYIRVGRYRDAAVANEMAAAADEDYIAQCRAQGMYPVTYYPHNVHFLWAALTLEGRGAEAIAAARKTAGIHRHEDFERPGFAFPHLLRAVPLFALTRFGEWDEILAEPEAPADMPFVEGVRRWARGMAHRARGDAGAATAELERLRPLASDPRVVELKIYDVNSLGSLLEIATAILEGEIAALRGDYAAAVAALERGVAVEDGLTYSEPRDWPQPARHSLGAVLLSAGRAAEAEQVYRADLAVHRDNGWSLFGLRQALEAQGKTAAAAEVRGRFEQAWAGADIELSASRL